MLSNQANGTVRERAARLPQPIHAMPLHDQVVRRLMGEIVRGEISPGAFLPTINALSADLSVSHTIVRQALKALAARGMVRIRHGVGTVVTPESSWNALDPQLLAMRMHEGKLLPVMEQLLEARRVLEVEIAALAAARATDDDLRALGEELERQHRHVHDPMAFIVADLAFHQGLLQAARNSIMVSMMAPVNDLLRQSRQLTLAASGMADHALRQHGAIYERVASRDEAGAREAMRRHLVSTEQDMRRDIAQAGGDMDDARLTTTGGTDVARRFP